MCYYAHENDPYSEKKKIYLDLEPQPRAFSLDKAKIDLEQFVLMLQRKKKLPQVCIYHLNLILHSQVVLSDQRGWEPSSVLSPRKPSPRCLSVVRATGRRGTLERKIPMEMKRADVETTKAGGAADARSAEAFIVVKNVHPRSD